ncbi:MAG: hypothetical protein M1819_006421 [Sarea resinae]|nr:MAG: hypothetical protein M1819_006421 [Sarea resinae]
MMQNKPAARAINSAPSSQSSSRTTVLGLVPEHHHPSYVLRNGRRFLRDSTIPYPLPCDLVELHRQNLRTILLTNVFGVPICAPSLRTNPPKKVLEVICGTGLWTSACHDYFKKLGHTNISFTGMDMAPLAPDLRDQGIDWRFVQHDLRDLPFPFVDEDFDLVFVKGLSQCVPPGASWQPLIDEFLRILRPEGVLEVWESDHIIRTIRTQPSPAPNLVEEEQWHADATGTFTISSQTPFTAAQNPFLREYSDWMQKALEKRRLSSCPCALVGPIFLQEMDELKELRNRRIAVPLGQMTWERDSIQAGGKGLTADQAALRRTSLLAVVQMIESLEPVLKEAAGKSQDEWDRWWSGMMHDLWGNTGTGVAGECLEIGAWWGRKRAW